MTTQLNTELKDLLATSDHISFENMTQEQFAVKLEAQRLRTTPSSKKRLKRNDGIRARDSTTDAVVYKPTHDQYYRIFINDILSNIRSGGTDYCFKWYQVKELLRFHKRTLICKMVKESTSARGIYFKVSLPNDWRKIEKNIIPEQ